MRIVPYFYGKLGKMSRNLLSAAVVIGALRVSIFNSNVNIGPTVKIYIISLNEK